MNSQFRLADDEGKRSAYLDRGSTPMIVELSIDFPVRASHPATSKTPLGLAVRNLWAKRKGSGGRVRNVALLTVGLSPSARPATGERGATDRKSGVEGKSGD